MNENYFVGTATLDLTNSDMGIFTEWRNKDFVYVVFATTVENPTPNPAALNVYFLSSAPTGVPAGIAVSNMTLTELVPIATTIGGE